MTTFLTTLILVGGTLACLVAAIYAVPAQRTWRKEHGQSLATPGPELEAQEREPDDEVSA